MKKLWMIISMAFLLVIGGATVSYAVGLEFAVGGWKQSPKGGISFDALGVNDILNLEDDLNYSDETRLFGRLKIDMPLWIPNIYLAATPMEFEGNGQKNVDFKFGDVTFQGNVDFYSKLTLDNADVTLYYGLPFIETATADILNVEVGLNVRV